MISIIYIYILYSIISYYIILQYILYIYTPRNAIAALLCQKAFFVPCYGVIPGAKSWSFFWATSFSLVCVDHVGAQRQRCALKLAQCLATWVRAFFFKLFSRKKTNGHVHKSCRRSSNTLGRNFPTFPGTVAEFISHYFLLLIDLQSPWRKRVLHCSGPGYWDHLFVSQAYAEP